MEKILSYVCFENAEAFEEWQMKNPAIKVANIQALVTDMKLDVQESDLGCMADATTSVRTFVTYWKDV